MIAILGTGRVGSALGPRFAELGHDVIYGSRNPSNSAMAELVEKTGSSASVTAPREAIVNADFVVFAMSYSGMQSVLEDLGDLDGQIVIDITHALIPDDDGLIKMAVNGSAGEQLQSARPASLV